jgi:hypothetical protein
MGSSFSSAFEDYIIGIVLLMIVVVVAIAFTVNKNPELVGNLAMMAL